MPQVPLKRTPVAMMDYARAVLRAWRELLDATPMKASVGVLWSQYMIETGGTACWGWNLGNVKITQAQIDAGLDWHDLPGTWEIINGQRIVLPEGSHGRRFRAFASLDEAMVEHLGFLRNRRYAAAWPAVERGDFDAFARLLKSAGYYTASADDYARGMAPHFKRWMGSQAWEQVLASEAPTERELPAAPETQPSPVVEDDGGESRRRATTEAVVDAVRELVARRSGGEK